MSSRPLRNLTREDLEPLWSRLDIPTERVARALGVTRAAVSQRAHAFGLAPRTGNQAPNAKGGDEAFRRMWLAGVSVADMARHFGYAHRTAVSQRRRRLDLPARRRAKGTQRGGWAGTISLAQFLEAEAAARMAQIAAAETARMKAEAVRDQRRLQMAREGA